MPVTGAALFSLEPNSGHLRRYPPQCDIRFAHRNQLRNDLREERTPLCSAVSLHPPPTSKGAYNPLPVKARVHEDRFYPATVKICYAQDSILLERDEHSTSRCKLPQSVRTKPAVEKLQLSLGELKREGFFQTMRDQPRDFLSVFRSERSYRECVTFLPIHAFPPP